jgi:sialic acid synthase SpsE
VQGNSIFENLFVLELANNHLGKVERGLKIIERYSEIVKNNQVHAAIKLQFRDTDYFIHKDFTTNESRYIKKTLATKLSAHEFKILVNEILAQNLLPMATPFDEASVGLCEKLQLPIIKIASSCIDDWPLINKILATEIPAIVSTGGAILETIDSLVEAFAKKNVPLAINHCVSLYPTEDKDLNLNQIDILKKRYPQHVIGFSTHEYHDWSTSIVIAYTKGARTFERHIDIEDDGIKVSPYCSLPHQVDDWFKAFNKAREMCGEKEIKPAEIFAKERAYLKTLFRGIYAKRDLPKNHEIKFDLADIYAAIPYHEGQITGQVFTEKKLYLKKNVKKDEPIMLDDV